MKQTLKKIGVGFKHLVQKLFHFMMLKSIQFYLKLDML